ncbi:hypothetical protein L798_10311 [Zootermopsis nevadensis]|uniref:Uncharacterized protein n=1 Tax=Zootermopsis nevadensis TaxID=136037 RepID=A0A067R1D2_ZOONE|nr:hypothetical protein L798_10311 [Zootermopsis nevadensis]
MLDGLFIRATMEVCLSTLVQISSTKQQQNVPNTFLDEEYGRTIRPHTSVPFMNYVEVTRKNVFPPLRGKNIYSHDLSIRALPEDDS